MSESNEIQGSSDPLSYTCTCPASTSQEGGLILLFYRYFTQPPALPTSHYNLSLNPIDLASYHSKLTGKYHLGGKIRVATEGFNITVGGTTSLIEAYISELIQHWSFDGLDLNSREERERFFKPSPGCGCAFGGEAKVNVKEEITPLGVSGYVPQDWSVVKSLEPWEWQEMFLKENGRLEDERGERLLIDVRNHYESRIGYFIDPQTNSPAIRPGIRRFSQWPGYASRFFTSPNSSSTTPSHNSSLPPTPTTTTNNDRSHSTPHPQREIFTYCTGGIRCEKGVRWLATHLTSSTSPRQDPSSLATPSNDVIYTLHGGISAYLTWMDEEIAAGRKKPGDSLFKGRNYVFDGRGSVGLQQQKPLKGGDDNEDEGRGEKVAQCHGCGVEEDRLGKCKVGRCHLVLVVCEGCEGHGGVSCCESCEVMEKDGGKRREMCQCEKAREEELWGGEGQVKIGKGKRGKQDGDVKKRMKGFEVDKTSINVAIETIS